MVLWFIYIVWEPLLYTKIGSLNISKTNGVSGCIPRLITKRYLSLILRSAQHCFRPTIWWIKSLENIIFMDQVQIITKENVWIPSQHSILYIRFETWYISKPCNEMWLRDLDCRWWWSPHKQLQWSSNGRGEKLEFEGGWGSWWAWWSKLSSVLPCSVVVRNNWILDVFLNASKVMS